MEISETDKSVLPFPCYLEMRPTLIETKIYRACKTGVGKIGHCSWYWLNKKLDNFFSVMEGSKTVDMNGGASTGVAVVQVSTHY